MRCADPTPSAACVDAVCAPEDGITSRCTDATHIETCDRGALFRGACRPGSACSEAFGGCVGAGDECERDVCQGDVHLPCDPSNHRTTTPIDCGALGLVCHRWEALDAVGCVPREPTECEPLSAGECRGDRLVYCGADARPREYDCLAHGYLGCDRGICTAASPAL